MESVTPRASRQLLPDSRLAVCLLLVVAAACNRPYYRKQADREVAQLIAQKSCDPRWGLTQFNVYMNPLSRYFEPYSLDRAPMPQDDPSSHVFMECVDGKRGWRHWNDNGVRASLENPDWRSRIGEYAPLNEQGEVLLTLDTALQLAYMHSPNHQDQIETLYLSALDVSAERFRLATQFFGGTGPSFAHLGRLRGPGGETNTLTNGTDFQLRRRFATAGELLIGFANSFVWQFAGPNTNSNLSILNLNLVQPLLRGAGQDIALEQLTIVERGLLANLRAYQRFRQGFFTQVAIGESGVQGPQRRGGFFGGTGLTGFTGQGAGGLGGVGGATGFGRGGVGGGGGGTGGAGFAGGGAGTVGGFIGLLQQLQEVRNTRTSLNSQLRTLSLLEANLQAGIIDLTQVDQFRQSIETERATLLQAENTLQNALDSYKTGTLGLPPDLPIALNDELIRQFQFIGSETTAAQAAIEDFQDEVGDYSDQPDDALVQKTLLASQALVDEVGRVVDIVAEDVEKCRDYLPNRKLAMTPEEQSLFDAEFEQLVATFDRLRGRFEALRQERQALQEATGTRTPRQITDDLIVWLRSLLTVSQELSLAQARSRVEAISVEKIDLKSETAFQIAIARRLDLMNNRASLVDTWRLIQFNADALQSRLDLTLNSDIRTVGDNPLKFRAQTGQAQMGLRFDAPFTRLLERNNYRQALIDYQGDRRQLIQFHDTMHQSLRALLRQLEQLRLNLEIQRRAVVIAIRRVDLTRENLNEPTAPPQPGQQATQLGPTAATSLLTALSDLRNTQNNFMSVWLNYYANRMRLSRELGVMELDGNGRWIEGSLNDDLQAVEPSVAEDLSIPPPVPQSWLDDAFAPPAPAREPAHAFPVVTEANRKDWRWWK